MPPSVLDIAPTLLHALGLPVGDDMDGRVLAEAFGPEWLAGNSVTTVPSYALEPGQTAARQTAEDIRAVEDRLRDLGYLD